MALIREAVYLPEEWGAEVQAIYLAKKRSTHGAKQETLARGAELALAELKNGPLEKHISEILPATDKSGDKLLKSPAVVTAKEEEFLTECLRIYRSSFGKPLIENVAFFGVGLSAVEAIAAMQVDGEREIGSDAITPSASERGIAAQLNLTQATARLLQKAINDAAEQLRGNGIKDQGNAGGIKQGRKGRSRKAASGGGD